MCATTDPLLHPAGVQDRTGIIELFQAPRYVHRHPGWRSVEDWLTHQPFWVLQDPAHEIIAALACPPEPEGVAWVRLFATRFPQRPGEAWMRLFEMVFQALPTPQPIVAAIALEPWFIELLKKSGFQQQTSIVILFWDGHKFPDHPHLPAVKIRPMHSADLVQVLKLDHRAFEPLWRLSWESLTSAFHQSAYATVAEQQGQIVGYQISTTTHATTCLERLAVTPALQKQHIGAALVSDLIDDFQINSAHHLTVNTQQDNLPSQALYQKMGFSYTGESYPVYIYGNA